MLRDEQIRRMLEQVFTKEQVSALIWLIHESYDKLVKVSDFSELKEIVKTLGIKTGELAEAQKRTEQRVEELAEAQKKTEQRLNELAEAQKKTEQRLDSLAVRVEELAEAQKKTEQRLDELAEAQKKTEQRLDSLAIRVEELAEAQKKTEQRLDSLAIRVEELAEAQRKTESQVQRLAKELGDTRKEVGGLAVTVGYTLENEAFKSLPRLLFKDHGIKIQGRLKRLYLKDKDGKDIEVNIFGEGSKNGKRITIIGESKSQLSKKGIDEFIRKRLNRFKGVFDSILPVLVTHMTSSPGVEKYAKDKGIILYFSYDF